MPMLSQFAQFSLPLTCRLRPSTNAASGGRTGLWPRTISILRMRLMSSNHDSGVQKWRERFVDFLFCAESDEWLTGLRAGLGIQVILFFLSIPPHLTSFLP